MAKSIAEYFVGQSAGYGGGAMAGGPTAPVNWAGTPSGPQTSRRLQNYPATRRYSYMQGNTVIGSSLYDTITPDDLKDDRFSEDEIFAGLRWEMKHMEYPSKDVARPIVIKNLEKNPKYYSDLDMYFQTENRGNIMEKTNTNEMEETYSKLKLKNPKPGMPMGDYEDSTSNNNPLEKLHPDYEKYLKKGPNLPKLKNPKPMEEETSNKSQLEMGIEIEKEHTDDEALAKKIAMDHLAEDPMYYSKLQAAGLGHDDQGGGSDANGACDMEGPAVVSITLAAPIQEPVQTPLKSSGLGKGAATNLKPTNLTAPETQVINNKNTVAVTKTPPVTHKADPLDHFASQIQAGISEKW